MIRPFSVYFLNINNSVVELSSVNLTKHGTHFINSVGRKTGAQCSRAPGMESATVTIQFVIAIDSHRSLQDACVLLPVTDPVTAESETSSGDTGPALSAN